MDSFTIKVPISVNLGRVKKQTHYLNLNKYRNENGFVNNNIKKEFKRVVLPLIPDVYYEQFKVHYDLYLPDKRERDIMNVLCIIDKSFCDVFAGLKNEKGFAPDDNYKYLQKLSFEYKGYDEKGEGYVMITVTEVDDNIPT